MRVIDRLLGKKQEVVSENQLEREVIGSMLANFVIHLNFSFDGKNFRAKIIKNPPQCKGFDQLVLSCLDKNNELVFVLDENVRASVFKYLLSVA